MPGPNYTREFGYNEESQLLSISHSGTLAYQYAYGADGNRRWAKEIANNAWTWYPCGVACGAGELVEQGSDLTGATWTTNAQYLRAGGGCSSMLIRRKSSTDDEYHHEDLLGNFGVITNHVEVITRDTLVDSFGVFQATTGSSESTTTFLGTCSPCNVKSEFATGSGILFYGGGLLISGRAQFTSQTPPTKPVTACDANKPNPDATKCQDCCDRYIQGWARKNIKKYPKDVAKCIAKCVKDSNGNSDRGECINGCFVDPSAKGGGQPSVIPARIYGFLLCCYGACDAKSGKFPPASCKGKLSATWIEKFAKWITDL